MAGPKTFYVIPDLIACIIGVNRRYPRSGIRKGLWEAFDIAPIDL